MAEEQRPQLQGFHEFAQAQGSVKTSKVEEQKEPLQKNDGTCGEQTKKAIKHCQEKLEKFSLVQWRKCLLVLIGLQMLMIAFIMFFIKDEQLIKDGLLKITTNGILYFLQALIMLSVFFANKSEGGKLLYRVGKKIGIEIDRYQYAEQMLRKIRWIAFGYLIVYLVLYPPQYDRHVYYPVALRVCALGNAGIVCLCTVQWLLRVTFRRWPNYVISAGNALLYLTVFDLLGMEDHFLGLFPFAIQSAVEHIEYMEIPVLEILALIGVSAVIVEVYKKTVSGVYEEEPKSVTQGRRRTRRKILSHWAYRNDRVLFSGENVVVWLLVGIVVYVLFLMHAIRVCREDAVYLAIAGLVCYTSGILAHWNIDNDRLIQSEYSYLHVQGGKITEEDVLNGKVRWRDFCQVLVEFYSSVSSVNSEDHYLHNIGSLLINMLENLLQKNVVVSEKFICDILMAKGDIKSKIIRDASYSEDPAKNSNAPKSSDLTKAQDILFSRDIINLLDYYEEKVKGCAQYKRLQDIPPLKLLIQISGFFFDGQDASWTRRFGGRDIGVAEGICLLKVDTLINILQMYSHKECALHWLWCAARCNGSGKYCEQCPQKRGEAPGFVDTCMADRMDIVMNYPLFVHQSFARRWSPLVNPMYYSFSCVPYFQKIYDEELYAGTDSKKKAREQINMAIQRTIMRAVMNNEALYHMEIYGGEIENFHGNARDRFRATQEYVTSIIDSDQDEKSCIMEAARAAREAAEAAKKAAASVGDDANQEANKANDAANQAAKKNAEAVEVIAATYAAAEATRRTAGTVDEIAKAMLALLQVEACIADVYACVDDAVAAAAAYSCATTEATIAENIFLAAGCAYHAANRADKMAENLVYCEEALHWYGFKVKNEAFNLTKSEEKQIINCDRVLRIAYHLFYDSDKE